MFSYLLCEAELPVIPRIGLFDIELAFETPKIQIYDH